MAEEGEGMSDPEHATDARAAELERLRVACERGEITDSEYLNARASLLMDDDQFPHATGTRAETEIERVIARVERERRESGQMAVLESPWDYPEEVVKLAKQDDRVFVYALRVLREESGRE
jgi:ubiquinone/menaquinone biosynthesis C-methylase UbiE